MEDQHAGAALLCLPGLYLRGAVGRSSSSAVAAGAATANEPTSGHQRSNPAMIRGSPSAIFRDEHHLLTHRLHGATRCPSTKMTARSSLAPFSTCPLVLAARAKLPRLFATRFQRSGSPTSLTHITTHPGSRGNQTQRESYPEPCNLGHELPSILAPTVGSAGRGR